MGLIGKPMDPAVHSAILRGIAAVGKAGKASGTLTADQRLRASSGAGRLFVAVGVDMSLLVRAASDLAGAFKGGGLQA